jgi:GTP-binding protein
LKEGPTLSATPPDEAELEAGRLLFAGQCKFFFAAQRIDQLPEATLPEVAFAGRSNVGKSSLVNALTGQKALARASSEPGRTKQLNFFDLAGRLILVDMPGYGYAQAAKAVKEDWQGLMFDFLRGRVVLRRVILLLDARIELKASDLAVMDLFDRAAVGFQCVLTKIDGVKPERLAKKRAEVEVAVKAHPAAYPEVIATSSRDARGIDLLRASLTGLAISAPNDVEDHQPDL